MERLPRRVALSVPSPYLSGAHSHRGRRQWGRVRGRGAARRGRDQVVLVTGAAGSSGATCAARCVPPGPRCSVSTTSPRPSSCRRTKGSVDRRRRARLGCTTISLVSPRWSISPLARACPCCLPIANDIARNVLVDRHLLRDRAPVRVGCAGCSLQARARCTARKGWVRPSPRLCGLAPGSPYAVSKVALEHLADVYARPGSETTALRLFNVYGPDEGLDAVVPRLVADRRATGELTIEGDGEQRLDFYVRRRRSRHVVEMVGTRTTAPRGAERRLRVLHTRSRRGLGSCSGSPVPSRWCTAPACRNEIADFVACKRSCWHRSSNAAAAPSPRAWRRVGRRTRRVC